MSQDEVKLNNELVEDISDAEELSEELVEDTQVEDEDILEAKAKTEAEHDGEDEEEEVSEDGHEDDEEEKEPVVEMPKTKAAIMAQVNDMLKKAKKDEAMKIYASVVKAGYGEKAEAKKEDQKESVDVDVSHIDYQEDLDSLVAEEATLSDGFKLKHL